MFPNFPICNVVKADIVTRIDTTKTDEKTVHDSFVRYISDDFIPSFNKNSTLARLLYIEPIEVRATLNITMFGVATTMNTDEAALFMETTRTILLGLLLNGTEANQFTTMNMEEVKVLHQLTTGSNTRRSLLTENERKASDVDVSKMNTVEVFITTSCARAKTCTDESLQLLLNTHGPNYGSVLMAALKTNSKYFYFDDLRNVSIGKYVLPELTTPNVAMTDVDAEYESERLPIWIIALIVAMSVIIITTILYIIASRSVRKMQSDTIRDGLHKNNEEKNKLRSTPFTPSLAPSFQQILEWSGKEGVVATQQQPQPPPPPRDTSIFHKRGQNRVQQPIHEYEEDEEYDSNQYDNDQFSVEAGNFGDNAYEEHQWNSSFRSYT
jgi:hypothetical protein